MTSEVRRVRRRRRVIAAVAAGLLTFTTACGGDGSGGDESESSSKSKEAAFEEYELSFAKCMRAEGIDFPDPAPEGEMGNTLEIDDAKAMEKATSSCEDELGPRPVDPNAPDVDPAEQEEMFAKFDKCLRDNGIDVPKVPAGSDGEFKARPALPRGTDPKIIEKCDKVSQEGLG